MNKEERFRTLYQKYYRRVVRFYLQAFRLAEEDAEELAQEAFLRFFEAMDEYRGDAEWAFFETIARNVAFNRIRAQKTKKRSAKLVDIDSENVSRVPAPREPDFADRQHDELQRRQLRDAIAELPQGQRETIQLWLDQFKYEEIAKFLQVSVDAVKSRLRDAKKALRDRLGDGSALPEDES